MVTTLRYLDELLSGFPDNTQGLITAEKERDFVISIAEGVGYLADVTDVVIPITDGVPVAVNPLLLGPATTDQLWTFDGNNFAVSNYSAVPGLTVPPGHSKLVGLLGIMSWEKVSAGDDSYSAQFTLNGVGVGLNEFFNFPAAGAQVVTLIGALVGDVSSTDTYGIEVTGQGTGDDLTLHSFEFRIQSSILLSAP